MLNDAINPNHYKLQNDWELIDVLEILLGVDGFKGFLKGNIIKYTIRAEQKNGKEDIEKAKWYSERLHITLEKEERI